MLLLPEFDVLIELLVGHLIESLDLRRRGRSHLTKLFDQFLFQPATRQGVEIARPIGKGRKLILKILDERRTIDRVLLLNGIKETVRIIKSVSPRFDSVLILLLSGFNVGEKLFVDLLFFLGVLLVKFNTLLVRIFLDLGSLILIVLVDLETFILRIFLNRLEVVVILLGSIIELLLEIKDLLIDLDTLLGTSLISALKTLVCGQFLHKTHRAGRLTLLNRLDRGFISSLSLLGFEIPKIYFLLKILVVSLLGIDSLFTENFKSILILCKGQLNSLKLTLITLGVVVVLIGKLTLQLVRLIGYVKFLELFLEGIRNILRLLRSRLFSAHVAGQPFSQTLDNILTDLISHNARRRMDLQGLFHTLENRVCKVLCGIGCNGTITIHSGGKTAHNILAGLFKRVILISNESHHTRNHRSNSSGHGRLLLSETAHETCSEGISNHFELIGLLFKRRGHLIDQRRKRSIQITLLSIDRIGKCRDHSICGCLNPGSRIRERLHKSVNARITELLQITSKGAHGLGIKPTHSLCKIEQTPHLIDNRREGIRVDPTNACIVICKVITKACKLGTKLIKRCLVDKELIVRQRVRQFYNRLGGISSSAQNARIDVLHMIRILGKLGTKGSKLFTKDFHVLLAENILHKAVLLRKLRIKLRKSRSRIHGGCNGFGSDLSSNGDREFCNRFAEGFELFAEPLQILFSEEILKNTIGFRNVPV